VTPGWRIIDNFEFLNPGHIGGQGGWQNALSSIGGPLNPAKVVDTGNGNKFLGFDAQNILAGKPLNSMTVGLGRTNTLFFRFYIFPEVDAGSRPDIEVKLGLTEKGLRDVVDFRGGNNGPSIVIFRQGGGRIDLQANNGINAAAGTYSYLTDAVNNPAGNGLESGKVYDAWMDIENRPFDVVGGVQNGGDRYSLHIQKQGDPARATLFSNYLSDRDAVAIDVVLGAAVEPLTHLFFVVDDQTPGQATNKLRLDDFFLSRDGVNDTVPVPAGSFLPPLRIIQADFNVASGLTITWNAVPGKTYTVNRRVDLNQPWSPIETAYPLDGAVSDTVSYLDFESGFIGQAFYQIVENP
jgi:hypothetical protein